MSKPSRSEIEAILAGTKPGLTDEQKEACGYLAHRVLGNDGLTADHARVLLALMADMERQRKPVSALCTALLESMDRVEEAKRRVEFLDQVIETNIRDNGVEENRIVLRDGTVLTGRAVDICYKLLRSIQDAVKDTRKSLGGSNER